MSTELQANIAANLSAVQRRIDAACVRVGRQPSDVTLVAVSKTRSLEEIRAAYACGVRHLGENRVEECEHKVPILRQERTTAELTWHMIGHVQSRKATRAVLLADVIQSVDSLRLAERLERIAGDLGRRLPILLEVNVSGEESKFGFAAWDEPTQQVLLRDLEGLHKLAHLEVRGLMTMAPIVPEPELARPVFANLRQLGERLRASLEFSDWPDLSMGMTDDFEVAIEEGATLVRIGRAIFGPRIYEE
jgi:PLP dependent protein